MFAAIVATIALGASRAAAQDVKNYTRATLGQWLSKYADAKPDFKPGDVLGAKDLERIRPPFRTTRMVRATQLPGIQDGDHRRAQPYSA
jgi:hypothetical protein